MRKFVVFDFDGTLCDSLGAFHETLNELALIYRFKCVDPAEIDNLRELSTKDLLKHLGIQWWKFPFVVRAARSHLNRKIDQLHTFAEVSNVLNILSEKGFELGILSSNSQDSIHKFLLRETLPVAKIISNSSIFGKDKLLKRLVIEEEIKGPVKFFYVGDETRDIIAAKKAGVTSVGVTWGLNSANALAKEEPDIIVDNPYKLLLLD